MTGGSISCANRWIVGKVGREEVHTLKEKALNDAQLAFVRKVVSELKDFDNLYYEVCNEPYFAGVADDWQRLVARTVVEAEKDFPYKHLIARNIANGSQKIDKPDRNVSIYNFHYANPPNAVSQNYDLNKVISYDGLPRQPSADDVDHFLEGDDLLSRELRLVPLAGVQPLDLRDRQIVRERLRSIGKDLCDVRRPRQRVVVQADEDVVFRDGEIGLDEVGVHLHREAIGRFCVLRTIAGCAAVGDELLARRLTVNARHKGHDGHKENKAAHSRGL